MRIINLIFLSILLLSCNFTAGSSEDETIVLSLKQDSLEVQVDSSLLIEDINTEFAYDLNVPSVEFKMPVKLEEISGLELSENGEHLFAIQDEKGNIYKINIKTGAVDEKIKFGSDGDYEGVATNGSTTYITKSNGTIYEVKNTGAENQEVDKFPTALKGKNDIEGLCYYPAMNSLLIACKGLPGLGETTEEATSRKFIYRFDLATEKMIEEPFYKITLENIKAFIEKTASNEDLEKFYEYLKENKTLKLSPSGIAIHPQTGDIYILSSKKKMLIVLDKNKTIQHLIKLKKKTHRQPEGITFGQDGTLYISNEGKGGTGKIFGFKKR